MRATAASGRSPRTTEAGLLAFAVGVAAVAAVVLGWSESTELAPSVWVTATVLAVTAVVAHVIVRVTAKHADPILLPLAFLLNGLGLVFVRRVDLATGSDLATTQTVWTVVSVGVLCATLLVIRRVTDLARLQYTFGLLTLLLLLSPLVPGLSAGVINGAQLWIDVAGMRFQPGEIAKLTMVVFLAAYLERNRALLSVATQRVGPLLLPAARHLAPVFVAAGLAMLIMIGLRDLGSALLLFGVFIAMLYVATGRLAYPALGAIAFAAGAGLAYQLFSHVRVRFQIWLDPWVDVSGASYQLAQSLFALGTGGLTGTGLGLGRPQDVPFSATDAIFVVIGEELGLLGATVVIVAFLLFAARGFKIAISARDEFSTLLAVGLTAIVALQAFVIIGGLTRLVPLTGITLPFVSYGGSSLVSNFLLTGLLLRISHDARSAAQAGPVTPPRAAARRRGRLRAEAAGQAGGR